MNMPHIPRPAAPFAPRRPGLLAAGLSVALLGALPADANIDQYIDAESATISGATLTDNGQPHALLKYDQGVYTTIVTSPVYAGTRAIRSHVPNATNHTYDRSETVLKDAMPMATHRVIGFSVYVPAGFPSGVGAQENAWLIFSQLWQFDGGMPPITLEVKPNTGAALQYQLVVRNDDTGAVAATAPNPWPVRTSGALSTGTWTRFVLDIQSNSVSGGYVKLYVNGTLVTHYSGKVGYSTAVTSKQTMQIRTGIYRTGGESTFWWPATTLYFDEIKYGDTLSEVL